MCGELCTDNRFEIIAAYKKKLIDCTNIESRPEEMAVIDNILFRFWQLDLLPPIPHGRLIDADAIADIFNMACAECKESCMEFDGVYADCDNCIFFGVKESFLNAPTVIEAEGET